MKTDLEWYKKRMGLIIKGQTLRYKSAPLISLELYYVACLGALGSIDNIKAHRLTFGKGLESLVLNVSIVHKHVSAFFFADEAEALGLVEPLDSSFCHDCIPPF